MNFAITGKKIVSSQPQKKITVPLNRKIKDEPKAKEVFKPAQRKPSLPPTNTQNQARTQKRNQEAKKQTSIFLNKPPKVEQKPKVQIKHEINENEVNETVKLQEPPLLPKEEPKIFQIVVRYNHYKDKFSAQNNVLKYEVIQQKYAFAGVFKGNYLPKLQIYRNYGNHIDPLTSGRAIDYSWHVQEGKQYEITINEDEEQESKYQRKIYLAPKKQSTCPLKKNQRVAELTKQMREMGVQELGSAKHKQLLQQRALEQILFS